MKSLSPEEEREREERGVLGGGKKSRWVVVGAGQVGGMGGA